MYRAMLWKEAREQSAILIALIVLGSGLIAAATALGSSTGLDAELVDYRAYTNAGRLAVLALTIAAGVVIGGSLFAGEIENETLNYLEMLPSRRWVLWRGKLVAGAVLTFATGVLLIGIGSALGALGSSNRLSWIVLSALLMFVAFGWGLFASAITQNTLAACAVGLLCAIVFGIPIFSIIYLVLMQVIRELVTTPPSVLLEIILILAGYAVVITPILLAGVLFTAPDRQRYTWVPVGDAASRRTITRSPDAPSRFMTMFWLVRKQWTVASVVGIGFALAAGLSLLLEEVQLLTTWPLMACIAGVCGGVFAWSDEQSRETFKFWGERRLPLDAPWLAKVCASFAQTLVWVLILFLPVLVRTWNNQRLYTHLSSAVGSGVLGTNSQDLISFLVVWPMYGFAFGHLAGLLFRKTIVALGVALLTAGPLAVLWLPSLLTGGVHHWLIWPVPLLVLLTTRLLLRAWSIDRLATVRSLATLTIALAACLILTTAGLSSRVFELPATTVIDEDLEFAKSVPQLDSEDGGRAFRQAINSGFVQTLSDSREDLSVSLNVDSNSVSRRSLEQLASKQWPAARLELISNWLTSEAVDRTASLLKEAAGRVPGPIENPRVMVVNSIIRDGNEISAAVNMLLARGMLFQQRGHPEEFIACLDAALAITRNARTQQPTIVHLNGINAEINCFSAVGVWIHRVGNRSDLIRELMKQLHRHQRECPRDPRDAMLTDRMIDRNTINSIGQWAPRELEPIYGRGVGAPQDSIAKQKAEVEAELASIAVTVPWERERFRRIMGMKNANIWNREHLNRVTSWFGMYFANVRSMNIDEAIRRSEAELQVALAHSAITLFAIDNNRMPRALNELVPRYLEMVPLDPFSRQPIGYRISDGETVRYRLRKDNRLEDSVPDSFRPRYPLEFAWRLHEPMAGVVGGLAWTDGPPPLAPGVWGDGQPFVHLDAVAAAVGGVVQWPLEALPNQDLEEVLAMPGGEVGSGLGFDMVRMAEGTRGLDWSAEQRTILPGQGIVWSIGPDLRDDLGKVRIGAVESSRKDGDILQIVSWLKRNRTP